MSSFSEYNEYDGLGLAELVRNGEVTAGEVVEAAIARIEALNPQLNAVIHTMYDRARAGVEHGLPEGPFTGVPFLIKDLFVTYAGEPLRAGSRFFEGFVPDHDSELVRRYKAAGLVTLGKTNLPCCQRNRVEGQRRAASRSSVSAQRPQNRAGHSSRHPARQ